MAQILPLQGIQYDQNKISDYSDVATPPYDVISESERDAFYERHPHNVIRLILGKPTPSDTPDDNPHTRAAACFRDWLATGILVRSQSPALYLTAVDFPFADSTVRRYGLVARIGLEPFEKKVILPHERTFSKVKSERLELMKVCHANFSPIFSLYTDEGRILDTLITASKNLTADIDFTDDAGHRHLLWCLTDIALHREIQEAFEEKQLFIADGHHRYETALNYRNWLKETHPDFNETHPANYIMMSLSSMSDPGLIIKPAHRILSNVSRDELDSFIAKAETYFDITTLPATLDGRAELISQLKSRDARHTIGVAIKNHAGLYLLRLKPKVMDKLFTDELPASLRHLDVTVLTRLIFMELLGFDQQRLDNEKTISYSSKENEAIDAVADGPNDISFILNSTKIEQVRQVAEEGLIMPRKSTYFYPKVITGHVLNDLLP